MVLTTAMDISKGMQCRNNRVGYLSQQAQKLRKYINHTKASNNHPNPSLVHDFRLADRQLIPLTDALKTLVYVNTLTKLDQCCSHLTKCTEFSFDIEGDHGHNFLPLTCLLQISTEKYNFVVDTVVLYEHIGGKLGEFFLDRSKVKTVFGTADLNEMKRDFGIFCNSVVDLQHVSMLLMNKVQPPSFQSVVNYFINKETVLAKGFQRFAWRQRPLPPAAIRYAERDASLLFTLFQIFKAREHEFLLNMYDYTTTVDFVTRKWVPPTISHIRCFNVCFKSKYSQSFKYLNYDLHFSLFTKLLEWSIGRAKSVDLPRKKILSNDDLAKLCINHISTTDELNKILSNAWKWSKDARGELLEILNMHKHGSITSQFGYTVKISTGTDTESSDSEW